MFSLTGIDITVRDLNGSDVAGFALGVVRSRGRDIRVFPGESQATYTDVSTFNGPPRLSVRYALQFSCPPEF